MDMALDWIDNYKGNTGPYSPLSTPESDQAPTSIDFIPFNCNEISSQSADSATNSDNALERQESTWIEHMINDGLVLSEHVVEAQTIRNSLAHEFKGLPHYTVDHIMAGLNNELGQAQAEDFRNTWIPAMKAQREQRTRVLARTSRRSRFLMLNSPGSEYLADKESSPEVESAQNSTLGTPFIYNNVAKGLPKYAIPSNKSIRFCLFNVGNISKPEVWNMLKLRLSPEIMTGLIRLENVSQPNGRKRIDFWIKPEVASKIKSAMYLTATARRNGTRVDHKYPLRELMGIWNPNEETRHWRIDIYRTWRERVPTPKLPKCSHLPIPQKAIATFNLNGINNKWVELNSFLARLQIGVIGLQETLVSRNRYLLTLPEYDVYTRPKTNTFKGQALAIHSSLTSYEVGSEQEDFYIHVKVNGLSEGLPWHIISVYLP